MPGRRRTSRRRATAGHSTEFSDTAGGDHRANTPSDVVVGSPTVWVHINESPPIIFDARVPVLYGFDEPDAVPLAEGEGGRHTLISHTRSTTTPVAEVEGGPSADVFADLPDLLAPYYYDSDSDSDSGKSKLLVESLLF